MTIFDLHAAVLNEYRDFVRSFILIADPRIREFIDRALGQEANLWPNILLQVSPSYRPRPQRGRFGRARPPAPRNGSVQLLIAAGPFSFTAKSYLF